MSVVKKKQDFFPFKSAMRQTRFSCEVGGKNTNSTIIMSSLHQGGESPPKVPTIT